jgi:hypothetical protein|tara:strand:+ start:3796 stop:4149 length:354 start_codon:yes stop_codon:yes gene_type:complete
MRIIKFTALLAILTAPTANAQMSLIKGSTSYLEAVSFIVTVAPTNDNQKTIKFINCGSDCPEQLFADDDTQVIRKVNNERIKTRVGELKINLSYPADTISYDKESLQTFGIMLEPGF